MPPPGAKLVGTIGDQGLELDGGRIYEYSGYYDLEWLVAPPERMDLSDPQARWHMYHVTLDKEIPDWGDLTEVSRATGRSVMDIASAFLSPHPVDRASAYQMWADVYGWEEFDPHPREMKKWEVEKRYGVQLGSQPKPLPITGVTPIPFQRTPHGVIITDDTNGQEYTLKSGQGTGDDIDVFKVSDDAYYVLAYNKRMNYIGLAFFARVRDLDQGKPHDPGGQVFLQTDHEIEGVFGADGFHDLDEDQMIEQLQHYV